MDDEPKLEYWELPEKKEGDDVYLYDPARARYGQLRTVLIFIVALVAFALAFCMNAQQPSPRDRTGSTRQAIAAPR